MGNPDRLAIEDSLYSSIYGTSKTYWELIPIVRALQPYLGHREYRDIDLIVHDLWQISHYPMYPPASIVADYDNVLLEQFNAEHPTW